jgi:hypothetical protein
MPVPRWGVWAESGPPPARDPGSPPPARASGGELSGTDLGGAVSWSGPAPAGIVGAVGADVSPLAAGRACGGTVRGVETIWATGLVDETGTWPATEPATAPEIVLPPVEPADAPAPGVASRPADGWAAAGGAAEATGRGVGFTVGAEGDTEAAAGAVEATAPRDSLADGD